MIELISNAHCEPLDELEAVGTLAGTGWLAAALHALPVIGVVLGLFTYWFAVADRHAVFLYDHLGASAFDRVTRSRYWMAGLVASSIVMVAAVMALGVTWLRVRVGQTSEP